MRQSRLWSTSALMCGVMASGLVPSVSFAQATDSSAPPPANGSVSSEPPSPPPAGGLAPASPGESAEKPPADNAGERPFVFTLGLGPTYSGLLGGGDSEHRGGVVLSAGGVNPLGDHLGFGMRLSLDLTAFHRFMQTVHAANEAVGWSNNAMGEVYDWAAADGDFKGIRIAGSIFAFVALLASYAVAGVLYLSAPFAPTSTIELDTSLDYNFRPDGLGFFVSGGLALAIFIPPDEAEAFTGVGPTVGLGYRLERVEFGWDSTVLPEVLHDGKDHRTGVITNVSIRCRF